MQISLTPIPKPREQKQKPILQGIPHLVTMMWKPHDANGTKYLLLFPPSFKILRGKYKSAKNKKKDNR